MKLRPNPGLRLHWRNARWGRWQAGPVIHRSGALAGSFSCSTELLHFHAYVGKPLLRRLQGFQKFNLALMFCSRTCDFRVTVALRGPHDRLLAGSAAGNPGHGAQIHRSRNSRRVGSAVSVPSFLHSPLAATSVISLVIVGQSLEWHSFGEVDAAPEQAFSSAHCRLLPVAKPFTPRCSESEPKA